jgi:acetoacetate decarboxylase
MPFDPTAIDGTPFGAPLVPPLPIRMPGTEILTVVYRTDRDAADAMIPHPLELQGDLVVIQIYRMHDAEWFGRYCESAVQIPVRLPDGAPAVYSPLLVLQGDGPVAAGRELYGQPKKNGEVALDSRGDLVVGVVERNGIEVITATAPYKQTPMADGALDALVPGGAVNVNLRVLPDGDGLRRELVVRTLADVVVREAWQSRATVEIRPNAQLPVHLLPVRDVVAGFHRIVDFSLPPGAVIHRYGDAA